MCFSKNLSLSSFSFGLFCCFLLYYFGPKNNLSLNTGIALFFGFVTFMQLIEYLLWTDIKCKNGLNKFASYLGPLFNHLQPIILFICANSFISSSNIIPNSINILVNVIYFFIVIYYYYIYIQNPSNLCTGLNTEKHLDWKWKKNNTFYHFYFFMVIFNSINFLYNPYFCIVLFLSFTFLFLSIINFHKNIGEFWCLFVVSIPLILLIIELINEKLKKK